MIRSEYQVWQDDINGVRPGVRYFLGLAIEFMLIGVSLSAIVFLVYVLL